MKKYIIPIIITFIFTFIFMFTAMMPMSNSEAMSIISKHGSVAMYAEAIYITIPESPSTKVLEATMVLSETKEGVYISVMKNANQ